MGMYLRRIKVKKDGKKHYYWALVESYRTEKGPRQRVVGYIGDVSKAQARKIEACAEGCDSVRQDFLSPEELPESGEVFYKKTRTKRVREFGGVWLGNKLLINLDLIDISRKVFDSMVRISHGSIS
jgi:hypothetical protein